MERTYYARNLGSTQDGTTIESNSYRPKKREREYCEMSKDGGDNLQ